MGRRIYDSARRVWQHTERYGHDGSAWVEAVQETEDEAVTMSPSMPDSYLGKGTILQRDASTMPVHPDSEAMAQFMWDWSPFEAAGGWGAKTGVNTSAAGTQPIHAYVVDSTHPACTFQTVRGSAIQTPQAEIDTYMSGQIPIPSWAVPAQNQDRGMAIYDVGTGIMREYFMVGKDANGVWCNYEDNSKPMSGGYSVGNPGLKDLAATNYALQQRRGISNVAGMHNSLGFIGITEALNKRIDHALCFTFGTAYMSWGPSWPARSADGKLEAYLPGGAKRNTWSRQDRQVNSSTHIAATPTHGQWGRLRADVDPMYNPLTGLPYRPFTRVLIEAAKKYGLVGTDTNLWCNAFNCEQGRTFKHFYGVDPWLDGGSGKGIIGSIYQKGYMGTPAATDVNDFPWYLTEWAEHDWGRPDIDFDLRPGQGAPWVRSGATYAAPSNYDTAVLYG